jgi:hypothetical protein
MANRRHNGWDDGHNSSVAAQGWELEPWVIVAFVNN